jgi:hypothetical protein
MASGFQQSVNQLTPNFYRVTIDLSTYYKATTDTSTAGGRIEPYDATAFATLPSSDNNSLRRARGNIRWNNIIMALSGYADCQILDVTPTTSDSTDANVYSSALAFAVKFERDDFVLQKLSGTSFAPTSGSAVTIDTVAKAVRYIIGQAIISAMTRTYRTTSQTQGDMQQSVTIAAPDTAANIYDTVSVSLIDTVTVINS